MSDRTKPKGSSWGAIGKQAAKPGGLALAFSGLLLGLVSIFVLPQWSIPAQWLVATLIIWAGYAWLSQAALRDALESADHLEAERDALAQQALPHAPRILQAMPNPADGAELMLLLQPNRLFGQSMLVSIYYEDERDFELFVGSGVVTNVQTNGLIQITVAEWGEPFSDLRRAIVLQDKEKLKRLLVRPAPTTSVTQNLPSPAAEALTIWLNNLARETDDDQGTDPPAG